MTYRSHPIEDYEAVTGPTAQLVDVRQPEELADGALADSVNIPLGDLPERLGELDPARPVVLFCRSGGRIGQAAEFLVGQGYGDVTNLDGGMLAFQEARS